MEHEAWLVDLDGTLYRPLPVKAAMAAELLLFGASAVRILRRFRHAHEELRADGVAGEDPYRAQIELTARDLGRSPDEVSRLVTEWMHERPGPWIKRFLRRSLLAEIRSFRERGGKTALVSDYPARKKLAAAGVADLFDEVVASGEPGGPPRLKPDPAGYLLAAERLGVAPERSLVIGDREDADGAAARAAKMAFRRIA
ncbi:MAG TPA: HAD family hydrolase [Polyangiaceae bacterium]|nr:HAD family hydrolase [Polyangiaceae bacterium]